MTVTHGNAQYMLEVKPGLQGMLEFQQNIRAIFGLDPSHIIDLTFGCKAPGTGLLLHPSATAFNTCQCFLLGQWFTTQDFVNHLTCS